MKPSIENQLIVQAFSRTLSIIEKGENYTPELALELTSKMMAELLAPNSWTRIALMRTEKVGA